MEKIRHQLANCLEQEGHEAEIIGREKHLYSIYQKMKTKKKSFSEIMDIFAFRIIVDSVDTCYRVLGCIHSLYKPVPGEFKDYIAIPKANGYQSLHSILFGPHGVPMELQIRTEEMDQVSESGIAAGVRRVPSTRIPKAAPYLATASPILPYDQIPRTFSLRLWPTPICHLPS